jgi:plasmid maintenance system antidote protein VapI
MPHSITQRRSLAHEQDSERVGTKSQGVEQLSFLPTKRTCPPIDKPYVLSLSSFRRAIRYSMSIADLEPKQVYEPLDMDKATWSRIENGQQAFPPDLLGRLAELTGNDAPLVWLAHSRGYELRPLRSELQERLEAAEAHALELERQNSLMRELLQGRR